VSARDLQAVIDAVHASRRSLIAAHVDPEGDSLGSQLVLAEMLRELGKHTVIVNDQRPPDKFDFMPGIDAIVTPAEVAAETLRDLDTAFVLDCGALERIGSVAPLIGELKVVNIDHHGSNTRFGHVNHVVGDACATGFLLHELNQRLGLPLGPTKAANMYAAIITDTGNFQYSNTTARVLQVAAELVDAGTDPALMSRCVFGSKPLTALKLLGEGLRTLHTVADGRVGIITLSRSVFAELGADDSDAEGVVNFAKRVKGTAAGVLLRETEEGDVKASFRSDGAVDVDRVARRFGGGGHHNAAGARLCGPLDEACRRVIEAFNGALPAGEA
jgi:phosphoesterase RecJ-like protein